MRNIYRYKGVWIAAVVIASVMCTSGFGAMAEETSTQATSSSQAETTKAPEKEESAIPVGKLDEITRLYQRAVKGEDVTVKLTSDIIVDRPEEWKGTKGKFKIITGEALKKQALNQPVSYVFRVVKGGSLTIENPNLTVTGTGPVIVVESEGNLIPVSGEIILYEPGQQAAVLVKKGGVMSMSGGDFKMNGTVSNENDQQEDPTKPTVPPVTEPETSPGVVTKPAQEPFCTLTADLISVDKEIAEIRLSVPELPYDTKEVYIYYSKNQESWEKVYWLDHEAAGEPKEVKNFVTEMQKVPPYTYIPYEHIFEEYKWQDKIYLRVEVVGPTKGGMTTVVEVKLKDGSFLGGNNSSSGQSMGSGSGHGNYSYGGYGGSYGGSGGGQQDNTTESQDDKGLPVIYFSGTAPYWANRGNAGRNETSMEDLFRIPKKETGAEVQPEQTVQEDQETSLEEGVMPDGEETADLTADQMGDGEEWDTPETDPSSGETSAPSAGGGNLMAAAAVLVAVLAAGGGLFWMRKKKK